MKAATATILSLLIAPLAFSQSAFAAAPLAPGKPAGVRLAQDRDLTTPLLVMGVAAVGIGIALAVAGGDDNSTVTPAPVTTTTTGTAP
ncbi:MAG: hypothetical protein ABI608_06300 [Rhizomicrobium sp.]